MTRLPCRHHKKFTSGVILLGHECNKMHHVANTMLKNNAKKIKTVLLLFAARRNNFEKKQSGSFGEFLPPL